MLFLLLFMVIVYSVFYATVAREQKQETTELATEVKLTNLSQFRNIIKKNKNDSIIDITSTNHEVYFCYVFDKNRNYIKGIDKNDELHRKILEKISELKPLPNTIINIKLENSQDKNAYIEIAGQYIYRGDQIIGMFLIGRDLTFYYNTFERLLFIMLGLLVIFLVIASFIGYFMARRAMVPIYEAYERQHQFVADASHELRTPLSVLQSSIEVIEMEEANNISEFSNSVLIDMKDEVRSMKKLVTDLLFLARSDSGRYGLNYELFDFNTIANQILRTTKALGKPKNIRILLQSPGPLLVNGDKEKFKQLIYILLDNAIKYSHKGDEIIISLSSKILESNNYFCMQVKDSGIGIDKAQIDLIFDRFYRNDKNRARETGGTGLGLAIAKSIVEAHKGKIYVESTLGIGTVFTILIPNKNSL